MAETEQFNVHGYFEAYCAQALYLLPTFDRGNHITRPQIVVLDTDQSAQIPRSIIRAIPPDQMLSGVDTYDRIHEIFETIKGVVAARFDGESPKKVLPGDIATAL